MTDLSKMVDGLHEGQALLGCKVTKLLELGEGFRRRMARTRKTSGTGLGPHGRESMGHELCAFSVHPPVGLVLTFAPSVLSFALCALTFAPCACGVIFYQHAQANTPLAHMVVVTGCNLRWWRSSFSHWHKHSLHRWWCHPLQLLLVFCLPSTGAHTPLVLKQLALCGTLTMHINTLEGARYARPIIAFAILSLIMISINCFTLIWLI